MYHDDDVVLSDQEFACLLALGQLAENISLGYPEGRGAKEEKDVHTSFVWLMRDYINLLEVTHDNFSELFEQRLEYLIERGQLKKSKS